MSSDASPQPPAGLDPGTSTGGPSPFAPKPKNERVSSLDGLRAVALLIIMGYHFGVGGLQGGFFSLDIFYVLSGFLITGLLLGEYQRRGRIILSAFWLRRARRLLPALLVMLVVVTICVRFVAQPGTYPDFRMSALSALFYFSNWWQIAASGNYFVVTGPVSPLTHTWSLAVEEQFYLIWPLVVLAVLHVTKSFAKGVRALLVLSVVGATASATEMALLYSPTANTTRLYFGTDTHAQSILIGAAMACAMLMIQRRQGTTGLAPQATSPTARRLLVLVGLVGFAVMFTLAGVATGTAAFDYQGGFAISALASAAVIIGAVCVPSGIVARVLSLRPLVWLGTISYGAYLWHFPIYIFVDSTNTGLYGLWLMALRFASTIVIAAASFYLVERPVMYGTFWRSLKAIVPSVALLGATVAVVVAGTVVVATAAPGVNVNATSAIPAAEHQQLTARHAFTTNPVRFELFGDSLALTLSSGLGKNTKSRFGVEQYGAAAAGCDLDPDLEVMVDDVAQRVFPSCQDWPARLTAITKQDRPDVVGILIGPMEILTHYYDGQWTHVGEPLWDNHLVSDLNEVVRITSSTGAKVVFLTTPYIDPPQDAPSGQPYPENQPSRVNAFNAVIQKVAKEHPGLVSVINLNKILDPNGHYTPTIDGITVRFTDGLHISVAGGEWLQPRLLPQIASIGMSSRAAQSHATQ